MATPLIITREQCRELDRLALNDYGLPGMVLMENAARGTAEKVIVLGATGLVIICCGKGNNGGDGLAIARHLDLRGVPVKVLLCADPAELTGDAATNLHVVQRAGLPLAVLDARELPSLSRELAGAEWIVDALLGTGAKGEPRPPISRVIDAINAASAFKLAVDIPSGLDCDTGKPAEHTIQAHHTCTFVGHKPGFAMPGARRYTGQVHVIDIGVPRSLIAEVMGG